MHTRDEYSDTINMAQRGSYSGLQESNLVDLDYPGFKQYYLHPESCGQLYSDKLRVDYLDQMCTFNRDTAEKELEDYYNQPFPYVTHGHLPGPAMHYGITLLPDMQNREDFRKVHLMCAAYHNKDWLGAGLKNPLWH